MTNQELEAMKAAFLARGGAVQVAPAAAAYGVDAEADKAKRAEQRASYYRPQSEQEAEQRAERVTQAYHVGGRRAALEELQGERHQDWTHY